ncbi:MAG: MipA/OmpV family protein, partial [Hydrogenophaga sp.]|nr:MipA/OmpV family protein [Hydrogenophaga sp.]
MTPKHSRRPARHPLQRLAACALLLCSAGQTAHAAEEKPLWEAGIGVATVSFPAYRGSDQHHNFLLPSPYFVYRGEFLKA